MSRYTIYKRLTPEEKIQHHTNFDEYYIGDGNSVDDLLIDQYYKNKFNLDEEYFKGLMKIGYRETHGVETDIYDNKREFRITSYY